MSELELGFCQGYMALQYHIEEAYSEANLTCNIKLKYRPPIAIFSKKYFNEFNTLDHTKKYDYCFIGSINSSIENRQWVIEFTKKHFTSNSIFVNTDNNPNWKSLGEYDLTGKNLGFSPKACHNNQSRAAQYRVVKNNLFYFETMCQSKYVLCPAGDSAWSFRFYEVLMCGSLPIVESWHHTYRTQEESHIKYEYMLASKINEISNIQYEEMISKNTALFKQYHLLN